MQIRSGEDVNDLNYDYDNKQCVSHLGETEIPIGRTELLGFGSGLWQVKLGGAGYIKSAGPSLTFGLGHCGYEKVVEVFFGAYH